MAVHAADAGAARTKASQEGLQVLSCAARDRGAPVAAAPRRRRAQAIDIATFSQELASLLAAGLSVVDSLRTLADNEPPGSRRQTLMDVVTGISEGLPLSTALERVAGRFPPLLVATVRASEQTGDLSTSLLRYAEHQQSIKALRDRVVGAAIYPMLLLVVGCVVVVFLLGVVVPKFAVLFESTRRELPWSSQILLSWGRLVAGHAWTVAGCAVAAGVALTVAIRRALRSGGRSRWVERLPLAGPAVRRFRHSQLYRTTGMLVTGGIAAPRALQLGASLLGDDDRSRLARAVTMIHEGRSLSDALREAGLADSVAASMLSVAQRSGNLAEILGRIASFHEARLQRSVELTSRLFEPILMIVIGLVIGAIVVLMYLPIFDLASSLQ
jgi:general secretion pathway protein F